MCPTAVGLWGENRRGGTGVKGKRRSRRGAGGGGGDSGHPGGGEELERRKDDLLLASEIHIQMNTISMS